MTVRGEAMIRATIKDVVAWEPCGFDSEATLEELDAAEREWQLARLVEYARGDYAEALGR